jgi:hypothetical protein
MQMDDFECNSFGQLVQGVASWFSRGKFVVVLLMFQGDSHSLGTTYKDIKLNQFPLGAVTE